MTRFCGECGSRVNETALFCGSCGKKILAAAAVPAEASDSPPRDPASWQPVPGFDVSPAATAEIPWAPVVPPVATPQPITPPPITPDPATWAQAPSAYPTPPPAAQAPPPFTPAPAYLPAAAYPAKKSNTLLKVIIAVVVVLCVGLTLTLAGLYYVAKKVTHKARQVAAQVREETGSSTSGGLAALIGSNASAGDFKGDPCRFLSKAAVSQAVGLPIIRTEAKDGGCTYIAKGDPADITAKHAAMMLGDMGADAQTQKTIQKFAGALFAQDEAKEKDLTAEASTGEVPVLLVSFTAGNAQTEMKMNRGALARLGSDAPSTAGNPPGHQASGDLTGIGDEAYVVGGSMLTLRKGNTVARFTYISCPCNTNNIKPLAQQVASQL